ALFPVSFLLLLLPRPPRSPLFPYTTLFRSRPEPRPPRRRPTAPAPEASATTTATAATGPAPTPTTRTSTSWRTATATPARTADRSEEHTSELQSRENLVCRLLLEKKKNKTT